MRIPTRTEIKQFAKKHDQEIVGTVAVVSLVTLVGLTAYVNSKVPDTVKYAGYSLQISHRDIDLMRMGQEVAFPGGPDGKEILIVKLRTLVG